MKEAPVVTGRDAHAAAEAARRVVAVHEELTAFLRAGLRLPEIDAFVARTLASLDCRSAFLGYSIPGQSPFPSHSCLSINACIVHGTHTMEQDPLAPGDLVSIDIGALHEGWIGDAAWTWAIEYASNEDMRLMQAGRASLAAGIAAMQPGSPLLDFAKAVQQAAEDDHGFHLVRGLGGHGYGRTLHEPPFISNTVPSHGGEWPDATIPFSPGLLVAVEPMLAIGTGQTSTRKGQWPIFSADGSRSVHYEADILIGEDGPIDLTEGLAALPNIVGRSS